MKLLPVASLLILAGASSSPAAAQCQVHKIVRAEGNTHTPNGSSFGISAALEGTTAVMGSHVDDATGNLLGAVHVFDLAGSAPQEVQKIVPTNTGFGGQFGWRVALTSDWLAVAAQDDSAGVLQQGSVVIYHRPGGPGTPFLLSQKLVASDPKPQAFFGRSVAASNHLLVVGAYRDASMGHSAGAVYVFERQANGTYVQVAKLTASDAQPGDHLGDAVAIHGDTLIASAPAKDDPAIGQDVGAVYVFERNASGAWLQTQKLTTSNGQKFQYTGFTLALDDTYAFLPVTDYDDPTVGLNVGAVFVFSRQPGGWVEQQKLRINDPVPGLTFGRVSLYGDRLLVSTASDGDLGGNSGSVYVYERFGSVWVQTGKMLAHDGTTNDNFGISASIWGDVALVGALGTDDACPTNPNCNSGAAYVFSLASDVVQYCSCPAGTSPCGNADDHGGCANSTGQGAVLSACGSGSVALDDLKLVGRWMPPNAFALLFMGGGLGPWTPFSDGRICVGAGATGIQRFPLATTDASGSASFGAGLVALSQSFPNGGPLQPGQTRFFQIWYRDPAGPCGTASNLSNSLGVQFRP